MEAIADADRDEVIAFSQKAQMHSEVLNNIYQGQMAWTFAETVHQDMAGFAHSALNDYSTAP